MSPIVSLPTSLLRSTFPAQGVPAAGDPTPIPAQTAPSAAPSAAAVPGRRMSADMAQMLDDIQRAQASLATAAPRPSAAPAPTAATPVPATASVRAPGVPRKPEDTQVYLVGGGISSLAAAVLLVRDAHVPGKNIHILEEGKLPGGALDASGDAATGYLMRGGRMFEEHFGCTYDLLSSIPSLDDPNKSARQDIADAVRESPWDVKARLIDKQGDVVDVSSMGFNMKDRWELLKLTMSSEDSLGTKRIDEVFSPHFFETNFWMMWCSMFAFEPWHSAVEMKRYLLRFIHHFPKIADMSGIEKTRYNQYDSMIRPMMSWLGAQGVNFDAGTQVTDLGLGTPNSGQTVERIKFRRDGQDGEIALGPDDLVIVTNGSMTAAHTEGDMKTAPTLNTGDPGGSWNLWKKISVGHPEFGNPAAFCSDIAKTKWESFTVTTTDPNFPKVYEAFARQKVGKSGLQTYKDSGWLMTTDAFRNPTYQGQPDGKYVWWGYALFPDREGDYVHKKMSDCTGEEILTEAFSQMHLDKPTMDGLIKNSSCRMAMMPYITSQFMPRQKGDRPEVIPEGSTNLAFVGQYCEMPDDTVFTVEYSVRSAMEAVYGLMGLDRTPPPVYKGQHDPRVLYRALKTTLQ